MTRLLTKKDVAKKFNVSTRTVDRMVKRGDLPEPVNVSGRTVRWHEHDIMNRIGYLFDIQDDDEKSQNID